MTFFTCFRKYFCVYSPSMNDVVDASKQDDLPAQIPDFLLINCTLFFLSPMCASCLARNRYIVFKQYTVKDLARLRKCASSSEPSL